MKKLSFSVQKPRFITLYEHEPKAVVVDVRDKRFVIDRNSLDTYELENGETFPQDMLSCQKPQFPPPTIGKMRCLIFEVTHRCNLQCSYCFLTHFYDDLSGNMSLETAQQAIKKLVDLDQVRKAGSIQLGFFGGEPLVNWKVLQDIVYWAKGYFAPAKVTFSVTTNACLVDDERARFMKEHNFSFIVSLDGDQELHDHHRKTKGGSGSFENVMKGIDILNRNGINRITFRSTFLPDQVRLLDRVRFLNELCDQKKGNWCSIEPACLTESRCTSHISKDWIFTEEMVRGLEDEYMAVADWAIERYNKGLPVRFHNTFKIIERLMWKIASPSECFTGDTKISLLNGEEHQLQDLLEKDLWVYAYDVANQRVVPAKARAKKTGTSDDMYDVQLDNGQVVRATGNHPWMLRDGTFRETRDLCSNDSLMPLYRQQTTEGYEQVLQPKIGSKIRRWKLTHQLVAEKILGWDVLGENVIHHASFNKRNNDPRHLQIMTTAEHAELHSRNGETGFAVWNSPDNYEKHSQVCKNTQARQVQDPDSKLSQYLKSPANFKKLTDGWKKKRNDPSSALYVWLHSEECLKRCQEMHQKGRDASKKMYEENPEKKKEAGRKRAATFKHWLETDENREKLKSGCKEAWARNKEARLAKYRQTRQKNLAANNHKVVSVTKVEGTFDTYCLEVEDYHNFALSAGVFVHNCGAGNGYGAVNPEGQVYACHREINSLIGDLKKGGIDENLRAPWIDNRSCGRPVCTRCDYQWVCGGGCRESGYGATGDIHTPEIVSCIFKEIFIRAGLWIMGNVPIETLAKFIPNPAAIRGKKPQGNLPPIPKKACRNNENRPC